MPRAKGPLSASPRRTTEVPKKQQVSDADKYKIANLPPIPAKSGQLTYGLNTQEYSDHLENVRKIVLDIRCIKKQDATEVEDARILRSIAEALVNDGTTGQDVADAVIACLEYKSAKKLEFTNEQFFEAFYMFRWYEMLHFAEWKLTLDDFVEFQSGAFNLMKVAIDSIPFCILYIQALRNLYRDHGGASLQYDNFKNVFFTPPVAKPVDQGCKYW
jgi:hypothetical protein